MSLPYTLPPDFNVNRMLEDIFPERKARREQAELLAFACEAEAQTVTSEFSDAVCESCIGFIRRNGTCDCPSVRRLL